MITLRTTAAGRAALNAALAGDGPAPVLDRMAIGGGTPPDPATVTAADIAAQQLQSAVQLAIAQHTSDIISGDAGFDAPAVADTVTWVALLYADGTPAAVGGIDGGLARIPGLRLELPWAWSSTDAGELALSINILDLSVLAAQVSQRAYDDLDTRSGGIVNTYLTPFASAVDTLMAHGNPRVHLESWTSQFRLRAADAVRVVGVIAGDDSLDLAEHTEILQDGDYVLFDGANSEIVRLRANLDLGRRRLVGDIQHTYPTATLSRTNWLITAGQATALAGQVYHSDTLRMHRDATETRIIIRAATATAAAPVVSLRWGEHIDPAAPVNDYVSAVLDQVLPVSGQLGMSDYIYRAPADGEFAALRVVAAADMQCTMISMQADWGTGRIVPAPAVQGAQAVPGVPARFGLTAQTRLVGGQITAFAVNIGGKTQQLAAVDNAAVLTMTLAGQPGDSQQLRVSAVDDLGNISPVTAHNISLVGSIAHPAPIITSPPATGASALPTLRINPAAVPGATHISTDWQLLDSSGAMVWQSMADANHLAEITPPAGLLQYGGSYTVRVTAHYSDWPSAVAEQQFSTIVPPELDFIAPTRPHWATESVVVSLNLFAVPETTHASTDWQLLDNAGTPVWQSLADSAHLLSITLPALTMQPMHTYTLRARQHGASGVATSWVSTPVACAAVWEWTAAGPASWTPPVDGDYEIVVVGGGGAGSTINGGSYMPAGNGGGSGYAARLVAALRRSHGALPLVVGAGGQTALATGNPANPGNPGAATSVGGLVAALGGLPGTDKHGGDGASGGGVGGGTAADSAGALYHGPNGMLGGWDGRDGSRFDDGSRGGVTGGSGAGVNIYYMIDSTINHAQPSSVNTVGSLQYQGGGVGPDNEYSAGGGGGGGGGAGFGPASYGAGGAGGSKGPGQYRRGLPGRSGYIRIKLLNTNPETAQ